MQAVARDHGPSNNMFFLSGGLHKKHHQFFPYLKDLDEVI